MISRRRCSNFVLALAAAATELTVLLLLFVEDDDDDPEAKESGINFTATIMGDFLLR